MLSHVQDKTSECDTQMMSMNDEILPVICTYIVRTSDDGEIMFSHSSVSVSTGI